MTMVKATKVRKIRTWRAAGGRNNLKAQTLIVVSAILSSLSSGNSEFRDSTLSGRAMTKVCVQSQVAEYSAKQ